MHGAGAHSYASASASDAAPPPPARPLLVLGIESSCDDTAAAVVTSDGRVLGEAIASQADIHAPWGETRAQACLHACGGMGWDEMRGRAICAC